MLPPPQGGVVVGRQRRRGVISPDSDREGSPATTSGLGIGHVHAVLAHAGSEVEQCVHGVAPMRRRFAFGFVWGMWSR